jgi:hypothetical protein
MSIRTLSREEFDRFESAGAAVTLATTNAVAWFADDAGVVLGALVYGESNFDWSCVVLGRDAAGVFRALGTDVGLRSHNEARRFLLDRMRAVVTRRSEAPPVPPADREL